MKLLESKPTHALNFVLRFQHKVMTRKIKTQDIKPFFVYLSLQFVATSKASKQQLNLTIIFTTKRTLKKA
jgi:hypothetical protein